MDILKRTRNKKRGVILITVLLLLTIIIMIVTLLMTSAMSSVKLASSYSDGEQAYYAAMSGMEYVRNRVYYISDWMQEQKSTYKPQVFEYYDSTRDLRVQIHEDPTRGTIVGYFGGDENNYRAKFEIAFLDFSQSATIKIPLEHKGEKLQRVFNEDYLSQTIDASIPKDLNYVSCNNFFNASYSSVYKRNLTNKSAFDKYMSAPPNSMYLIVRGEANRKVKVIQSVLSQGTPKNVDTSSVARGAINVGVGENGKFHVDTETDAGQPVKAALRAYGQKDSTLLNDIGISVDGPVSSEHPFFVVGSNANKGTLYAPQIKVNDNILDSTTSGPTSPDTYGLRIDSSAGGRSQTEALLEGGKNIDWQYINKEVEGNTGVGGEIPSGAYIYVHNLSNSTGEWKYFSDISVSSDGSSFYINNPESSEHPVQMAVKNVYNFQNGGVALDPKLTIEGVTKCNGPLVLAAVDDVLPMAVTEKIIVDGIEKDIKRIKIVTPLDLPNSRVSKFRRVEVSFINKSPPLMVQKKDDANPGEMLLCGKLTGQGKVYSQGNIYFEGGSFFDTQANSGVSVYAEKNVNIIPSDGTIADEITNVIIAAWGTKANPEAFCNKSFSDVDTAADKFLLTTVAGVSLREKIKELSSGVQEKDLKSFAKSIILQNCILAAGGGVNPSPPTPTSTPNALAPGSTPYLYKGRNLPAPPAYQDIYKTADALTWIDASNPPGAKVNITVTQNSDQFFVVVPGSTVNESQQYDFTLINSSDSKMYHKIWVHKETDESMNPNDLYIYIPSEFSTSTSAYIMMGKGKLFDSDYDLEYKENEYGGVGYQKFIFNEINWGEGGAGASEALGAWGIQLISNGKNIGVEWDTFFKQLATDPTSTLLSGYNESNHYYTAQEGMDSGLINSISSSVMAFFKKDNGDPETMNVVLNGENKPSFYKGEVVPENPGSGNVLTLKDLDVRTISKNTLVKGMFFTRNGSFNANDFTNALTIKGGIVAYGGSINVNASTFNLNYAPEYMQFFSVRGVNTFYSYRAVFDDYNK